MPAALSGTAADTALQSRKFHSRAFLRVCSGDRLLSAAHTRRLFLRGQTGAAGRKTGRLREPARNDEEIFD